MALATNLTPDIRTALASYPTYPDLFSAAFGDPTISASRIGLALATYQRTTVPDQTPWDEWERGNTAALTVTQQAGLGVFMAEGRCRVCHHPPLFSDGAFHNLGIRPPHEDMGRAGITGDPAHRGKFKTPTLRNVGLRLRGMHNGQMPALGDPATAGTPESMVEFYLGGGGPFTDNKDPQLVSLSAQGVPRQHLQWAEDFVRNGLTDPRVAAGLPPFDRPTLASERPGNRSYGADLAAPGAAAPFVVHTAPAFVGGERFKLGLSGAAGGAAGILAFSCGPAVPPLRVGPLPVNLDPTLVVWQGFGLAGSGPAAGYATFHFPVPRQPALRGLSFYTQMFALDPRSAAGLVTSRGVEVPIR